MRFLRIIHIYLLIGALAGCFFSFPKLATTILPFCIYVGLTAYLLFLFFKHSPNLLFNSLVFLFIIQLISIKTMVFGYLLSMGFCFFIGFGFDPNAARETLFGLFKQRFFPCCTRTKSNSRDQCSGSCYSIIVNSYKRKMMKKFIYLIFFQSIFFLSCKQPNLKPILVVNRDSIDIGSINFADSARLQYVLSNKGDACTGNKKRRYKLWLQ